MMSDDPIDRALGLRPIDDPIDDAEYNDDDSDSHQLSVPSSIDDIVPIDPDQDETVQDIERARVNIGNIIKQGDESLKEMILLAKQSESPRAFEVASTLIQTLLTANKEFVDMSMKKKYAKEEILEPKEAAQTNITNNNLILSTADLLRMMKDGELKE